MVEQIDGSTAELNEAAGAYDAYRRLSDAAALALSIQLRGEVTGEMPLGELASALAGAEARVIAAARALFAVIAGEHGSAVATLAEADPNGRLLLAWLAGVSGDGDLVGLIRRFSHEVPRSADLGRRRALPTP